MTAMPKDDVVTTVRLPRGLHEKLARVAEADHSSINRSVVVAVERYVRAWEGRQLRAGAERP